MAAVVLRDMASLGHGGLLISAVLMARLEQGDWRTRVARGQGAKRNQQGSRSLSLRASPTCWRSPVPVLRWRPERRQRRSLHLRQTAMRASGNDHACPGEVNLRPATSLPRWYRGPQRVQRAACVREGPARGGADGTGAGVTPPSRRPP
jgi:hypothetical protein